MQECAYWHKYARIGKVHVMYMHVELHSHEPLVYYFLMRTCPHEVMHKLWLTPNPNLGFEYHQESS